MITESEILDAVQKELSKQYLEVSRLEHENEKLKKKLGKIRMDLYVIANNHSESFDARKYAKEAFNKYIDKYEGL